MLVKNIAARRKCYCAVTLCPPPPNDIEGACYEGENLLIDRQIIARCNIEKGMTLTLDEVKDLCHVSECLRAKNKAVWYLSRTDYSEKLLFDKLCRTFTKKASAFAVAQMVNKGYLNDERFALSLISRLKGKNASVKDIRQKLYLKGISKDICDALLKSDDLTDSDYDRLLSLIKSKYINKISAEDDRRKTAQALRRRGFSFTDINKALNSFNCSDCDEEIF